MATALWVTLAVVTCVQLCRTAVVFTGNDNAIVLNWPGPDPAVGWTFLARVSFDSPTAAGKYYTVFSNWDYAAPTGAAGGTGVPACTNTGGLWYGYAVSDTSLWSYAYQVNAPGVCANTGNGGSSGFVTLATKTEVGIGIEFNGTSQDSLMRAYVLNSNVFGTTGVKYSLPTTNQKTYLFANTPGTIRDIAFIQGDIGFSLISQYTRGTRAISAATPNLLLWYSLSDFVPAGQTISPTAGSLNVQLSFLSSSTILSAPQTNCGSASFITAGTGCVVGNSTTKTVNPDGSFTASVEALALLPDTTLFLGLKDKITADGAIQLAGALELNVTDELTGDFVANLLVSDTSGLYGTFNSITVRPPTGSACTYDTRPAYSPAAFSVTISPSGCGKSSSKKGVIIGAVVGGVVGLVIIVVVIGLVLVYKFPFIAAKLGYRSALQRGSVMGGRRDRDVMTI